MYKRLASAFTKLEKREHRVRMLNDRLALGRITYAEYLEQLQAIEARYALTPEEKRVYDQYIKQRTKRK